MLVLLNQWWNDLDSKHCAPVWVRLSPWAITWVIWPRKTEMKTFLGVLQWRQDVDVTYPCSLHICNTCFPSMLPSSGAKETSWRSLFHCQTAQLKKWKLNSQNSPQSTSWCKHFFLFYQTATIPWMSPCSSLVHALLNMSTGQSLFT